MLKIVFLPTMFPKTFFNKIVKSYIWVGKGFINSQVSFFDSLLNAKLKICPS